ncbi:MAG: alkaline phosphatase family protein [Burkholderiales bacterium]|nr:alkaline phosphatase family protein [Burkholderiales bacterium]
MSTSAPSVVLVVCDSLRPDLVDARTAPTLARLRDEAAFYLFFRGVFPSTTRTSAASIATGCLPARHGLLGNTMVLDEGDGLSCLSAGRPDFFERLRRATGRALGRPTLAERVSALGPAIVMSNVSPGAAYAHDPEGAGFVYHRAGSFGPGRSVQADGLQIAVGAQGDAQMTQRFCAALEQRSPPLAVLWLSEPDHTGHHFPLGSPEHRRAIGAADQCVARVLQTIDRLDPSQQRILCAVCSDHGMETVRQRVDIAARLVQAGWKAAPDSSELVVAPQGTSAILHFAPQAAALVDRVACWLLKQDFVDRVFVGADLAALGLPAGGSLAIALTLAGDDQVNEYGVAGRRDVAENALGGESKPGNGQHGGLGRHEQRPFLALRGGGFEPGHRVEPASLVDLAPTFLRHLGLPAGGVDGMALSTARPGRNA